MLFIFNNNNNRLLARTFKVNRERQKKVKPFLAGKLSVPERYVNKDD